MNGRVLVVDDNEMNRDMLSRRVERQGHTVKLAKDGLEALAILRTEPIDLVLLDIMMPGMNGYEVLEAIKSDQVLHHIPVIMISAVDEIDSVVRCIEMGAEDYLPKPFNPVLLRARIGAALDKKQMRDQEQAYLAQIEAEKLRVDELLHVLLPDVVVAELKATNTVKPRRYDNVAVLFADIVGFTSYCDRRDPEEVIPHLQKMVEVFEELTQQYDLEKIKTIGDSYMTTGGLLRRLPNPVLNCIKCGLDMVAVAPTLPTHWKVRVGIHVGPVVAGVVGRRQYLFDVWGDTVNTAARIEGVGVPDAVNISGDAWKQVAGLVQGESRGLMNIRGKGDLELFRIDSVKLA